MIVYAVVDDALSPDFPLGDAVEVFVRCEDAERFIAEARGDDPEVAAILRIEEQAGTRGGWAEPDTRARASRASDQDASPRSI